MDKPISEIHKNCWNKKSDSKTVKDIGVELSDSKKSLNIQKKWSAEEDKLLLALVDEYKSSKIKWTEVSTFFSSKSTRQCYARFRQIDPTLNKGLWSKKEDEELLRLITKHGKKWALISKMLKTRSSKQIRDRYLNVLDESLSKNTFTEEEDKRIVELIFKYGSNWALISKEMPGRTGDNIKNRYNWYIKYHLPEPINLKEISKYLL